ncbi:bifunctional TVP38/TMEM64 family protein/FAD-dependent oxidoreductase [Thiobacillus sp.]|uniref:FAD-dependent oxidoreductase n=1 Tax=Thiobacillus sp. TaxID=924 RepID=UPI0011D68BD7|nr:bifunctional TVP38/TMEM64 family protein/FAD-dependent oxidoreductase [Thiobacillus sp.]TXH74008.1 MAG: pyridine nucleotide-disulfide oxidoreductase [Thiobacillus sp.]
MKRIVVLVLVAVLLAAFFAFDLGRFLTLETLKGSQEQFAAQYAATPFLVMGAYFAIYVAVTALSLPGAAVMTLAGGALFGLSVGTLLVSFASSLGATLAFLAARFVLRESVQHRFGDRLDALNAGIEKDGAFYLFTLRLVPLFPFFVINLLMGLTPIRTRTFYWVSQVGMLAGTLVYVNAGTQLARIDSLSGILSPGLLASFALLGVFPLLAKKMVAAVQARKVYAPWPKPTHFDRNLVVIGAGAAGLVTAYIAAAVKAKVTLIEGHKMGGDCLNYGCVPSKALIRSARFVKQAREAAALGMNGVAVDYDFAEVMNRVRRVVRTVEPHDSVERYTKLGVEVIEGQATITSPWSIQVNGRTLTTRAIVVATGAAPLIPDLPGLANVRHYTSDTIWDLTERPERLVVLGGGPIGCELAQAFARLGCRVTLVARSGLMGKEDPDAAAAVESALAADGVRVLKNAGTLRCQKMDGEQRLWLQRDDHYEALFFDALLLAVGREPRTTGFGLEALGMPVTSARALETNSWLQTRYPNIYACGDVAGPYQFTHAAAHQAWYAAVNALFGGLKRFKADYSVIPWVTFTDPEVARVGLSETDAERQGIAVEVTRYGLNDLDRAIAEDAAHGYVKVLTVPGKDRILGVTIVGAHAGEMLSEFVLAMRHGLGLNKILGTIHPYPTWSEANKYAAGEWKRAHAPQKLLDWVARYHAWMRG